MKYGKIVKGRRKKILSAGGRFFCGCLYTLDNRVVRNFLCFLIKKKIIPIFVYTFEYTFVY
jgi:hypothetical protein